MVMGDAGTPVGALRNLGPKSAEWLAAVGVETLGDLEAVGAVNAYLAVRAAGFNASLNLLYALQATLLNIHWTHLPPEERARLRALVSGP